MPREPSGELTLPARVAVGLRRTANWLQLVRFGLVGASGFVVNLAVYTLALPVVDYRVAASLAFVIALANNFGWNRHWTFRAADGHAGFQAARFVAVSLAAFAVNLMVLQLLVDGIDLPEIPAQVMAVLAATPVNFVGNKLWSFRL
ncbi:MAG TPA: GtrA family protein [Solirubrobacteraceae bacterium]|nr:GtrA family protein [Solirubrobacteraceae bacterium]